MIWYAVFFDFDGVILDSVHVKTRAFAKLFRPFGSDIEQAVVKYHLANGGVSRFEKFRYIHKHFLRQAISEDDLAKLGTRFADIVVREVLESPFIEGCLETLEFSKKKNIPMYVVSATPHDEIRHIVEKRGLTPYFEEVHGSPRPKQDIIRDVISRCQYDNSRCLMLGDSITDYHAALSNSVVFLGIVPQGTASPFPQGTFISPSVHPFSEYAL